MGLESARFHFVGIGGIGMCGLAELLKNLGAEVTGSDLSRNTQTQRLEALDITIFHDHSEENLGDVDVLVYSSAVKKDNPEVQAARKRKIPIIRRAEALSELMRLKRGIAVAGTHGKTTTTSLAASSLISAKLDPTVIVGGRLGLFASTAKWGKGEWLIAEADESDGSFDRLSPEIVILTNVDNDHLDHYGDLATLKQAFFNFASSIPFYGLAIVCGDDSNVRELMRDFPKRYITYGFSENNDYVLAKGEAGYKVTYNSELLGCFQSSIPGDHNALNSLAVIVLGRHLGLSFEECLPGLEDFSGVDRRFQEKGAIKGTAFYDDYGHHPTEVKATLKGFKDHFKGKTIKVIFQPHRFSRTELCWNEFLESFKDADRLFVTDIYPAGETPISGVNSENFVEALSHPAAQYFDVSDEAAVQQFSKQLKPEDVVLTLGAGDIYKFGENLLKKLAKESK